MSDEENKLTPQATPAWMQTQEPKLESLAPKSKRTRRTKAQMAEVRASNPPPSTLAGIVAQVDDDTARTIETVPPPRTIRDVARSYLPIMIALIALAVACAAHVR